LQGSSSKPPSPPFSEEKKRGGGVVTKCPGEFVVVAEAVPIGVSRTSLRLQKVTAEVPISFLIKRCEY